MRKISIVCQFGIQFSRSDTTLDYLAKKICLPFCFVFYAQVVP